MRNSLDEIRQFICSDIVNALAALAYIESPQGFARTNVVDTLKYLGLSNIEAESLYYRLDELLGSYLEVRSYSEAEARKEELKEIISSCLESLGVEEESWKRIHNLTEYELKILKIAAFGIMKEIEKYKGTSFENLVNPVEIANFVSVMLSTDIDCKNVEHLLVKTSLAVKCNRGPLYYIRLVSNNLEVIERLAADIIDKHSNTSTSEECPNYEYILSKLEQSEPQQVAALLSPDREFYRAVYGFNVEHVLKSLTIEKIVYRGIVNKFIRYDIEKAARELAQRRCHALMIEIFSKVLESIGYEIDLECKEFDTYRYSCKYTAVKPGLTIHVYICPFAVKPPYVSESEKIVMIVEGLGADLPKYLEKLKKDSLYAHLVNALWIAVHGDKIYVFELTVRENWQKEIVNALGEMFQNVYIVEASGKLRALSSTAPATVSLTSKSIPEVVFTPPQSTITGVVKSREILEAIVAQALQALGFNVWVNVRKPARRGASIEVDVWAEKRVGNSRFKVYVSCKNWNRDVDRSVVDEEFGRVFNLQEVPHLKILVVRSMSEPAREVAEADGFFVIELGEKTTEANAEEIYRLVYKKLSELFTGIAPPQLLEIARRVGQIAEELNRIAQELARLSQSYKSRSFPDSILTEK